MEPRLKSKKLKKNSANYKGIYNFFKDQAKLYREDGDKSSEKIFKSYMKLVKKREWKKIIPLVKYYHNYWEKFILKDCK